jgi:hypothetical protein
MSRLKQPLRLWHGLLAVVAALAVGVAGTAIAGGGNGDASKGLTTAGFGGRVFFDVGKTRYGFKQRNTPTGNSQRALRLTCPRGTKVLGGGGGGFSNDPTEQNVNFSGPFDSGDRGRKPEDGWRVFVNTVGGEGGEGMEVSAICQEKGGRR